MGEQSRDGYEIRSFSFDVRSAEEEDSVMRLSGHAAVFNQRTELFPGLTEEIEPGAFAGSLQRDTIYMAWNHNPDIILAGTRNGSLVLAEDETGLNFQASLANTNAARDAHELVRSGVICTMSFGFMIRRQEWDESDPNNVHRRIKEVRLLEISPVPFPSYDGTAVAARAKDELLEYRSTRGTPVESVPEPVPDPRIAERTMEIVKRRRRMLVE